MPIKECQINGESGYKWGDQGKCYVGEDAKQKAINQGISIGEFEFESFTDYPQEASENAKIALRWAEKNGWGSCGTPVGKARANQLANREPISKDTISRMASFERHRQNSQKELGDGCGRLMWLAWGGDAGVEWAQRKLKRINKKLALSKIDKFLFKIEYGNTRTGNNPSSLKSSNVWKYKYDDKKLELVVKFQDGETYTYFNVSPQLYELFSNGNGICITEGKNEYGEWFIGKSPSMGAAVHELLSGVAYSRSGQV